MNRLVNVMAIGMVACGVGALSEARQGTAQALTAQDRMEIQQLSARYVETLGACAAADYAALFASDGFFFSGFRGKVQGSENLMALVRSERHCMPNGAPRPNMGVPTVGIHETAAGASGTAVLGNNGGVYEDVYVRTPQGWRFKSRSYFTAKEIASRGDSSAAK